MSDIDTTRLDLARDARLADTKQKEKPREKNEPSRFDHILEQSKQQVTRQQSSQPLQQRASDEGAKEARRREEFRDRQQDQRRDKEEGDGEKRKAEGTREGKAGEQKIVAKASIRERQGGQGGDGGRGGSGAGNERKSAAAVLKKDGAKQGILAAAGRFSAELKAKLAQVARSPQLPQEIINQLVQQIRLGLNMKGEKEIQIDLQEKIFRGLKLRVTSREGKVAIAFRTADLPSRDLFISNKEALRESLEKKGIHVDEISIS